jgi:hypothetical protein
MTDFFQKARMVHAVRRTRPNDPAAVSGLRFTLILIIAGGIVPGGLWLMDKFVISLASLLGLL